MARFLLGAGLGGVAGGITYGITQTPPWWWLVGLVVAALVWLGKYAADLADVFTD
ncbi:hypothetical protein [Streptomyces sulphureus]|uniref:hypothetical protein n=1 Tax=Streptomyces sulphureus TaxID=47758 RepID=UPI0003606C3F|nr:hypothetical protein [Streptomyces sulphureus]